MKHLFYIHSFITYIVSVSVVSELALDHHDVVFIYGRGFNYRDLPDIKTVELPDMLVALSQVPSYGKRSVFFRKYHQIAQLDKLIITLMRGEKFTGYLPLSKNYLMQLLATHPKCADVIFLEEGLLSYSGNFNKATYSYFVDGWRGKLAAMAKYPNHGNRSFYFRPYTHSRPVPIYMIHDAPDIVEPGIDVRVLKSVLVPPLDSQFKFDNSYLLVIDTVVENGITSSENFLRTLDIFIAEALKAKQRSIWIRFRPHYPPSKAVIARFEENSIGVKILPDEICVESVLHYSMNLTVVGLHSSLLFYAAIWGCKSYSLLGRLFDIDHGAEKKYKTHVHLPAIFYSQVHML